MKTLSPVDSESCFTSIRSLFIPFPFSQCQSLLRALGVDNGEYLIRIQLDIKSSIYFTLICILYTKISFCQGVWVFYPETEKRGWLWIKRK